MEKEKRLPVRVSRELIFNLDHIYTFGIGAFGIRQAELYEDEIWKLVDGLTLNWQFFSERRHLPTKSKMYRWIILESHLIIYRITASEIQVLSIVNSLRSITKIKESRSIKL